MRSILAYIDIGTGSMIVSSLIAALVAVPFVLRQQIARVAGRLRRTKAAVPPTDTDSPG
jgi:hypothetical protein